MAKSDKTSLEVKRVETFDAFVTRIAPEHADIILNEKPIYKPAGKADAECHSRTRFAMPLRVTAAPFERSRRADNGASCMAGPSLYLGNSKA